jgi:hypothetical protein
MKTYLATWITLPFWASPNNSIYDLILQSGSWKSDRRSVALDPGFPRDDPVQEPPMKPIRPVPTDVPATEPRDVPARGPIDDPPPDPTVKPKPIKPIPPPRTDPKPRPTP